MEESIISNDQAIRMMKGNKTSSQVGIGYVVLPSNIDRDPFMELCQNTKTISIYDPIGATTLNNCIVAKDLFNFISFPEDTETLGSAVMYATIPVLGTRIVFSVIDKKGDHSEYIEKGFSFQKTFDDTIFNISIDPKVGLFQLDLTDDGEQKLQFNINIKNKSRDALINLFCSGELSIQDLVNFSLLFSKEFGISLVDDKSVQIGTIQFSSERGFILKDQYKNIIQTNKDGVTVKSLDDSSEVLINKDGVFVNGTEKRETYLSTKDKKESVSLANQTISIIDSILEKLSNPGIYVTPSGSPGPLNNAAEFAAMRTDPKKIASNIVFVSENK